MYRCFVFKVNVALNKPAYQQYPYDADDDRYRAANAVDGQKSDLSWWGGQCAVSVDNKKTATWWVNLTSIHNIHHIKIYFRTDNYGKNYDILNDGHCTKYVE